MLDLTKPQHFCDIKGMAYIKDSRGVSNNLTLAMHVKVDLVTNTTDVSYTVSAFNNKSPDHVYFKSDLASKAAEEYNRLYDLWAVKK